MPLALAPVEEADLPAITKIEYAAFENIPSDRVLHPNGHTQKVLDGGLKQTQKKFTDPDVRIWKVIDTDLDNKPVAFGLWNIFREDQTLAELRASEPGISKVDDDVNAELLDYWDQASKEAKRKTFAGKKRLYLTTLCTHPNHQGRGAGTLLLEKGAELADEVGLDTWLSASAAGLPLYKKVGFKEVDGGSFEIDLRPFGGHETVVNKILTRPRNATDTIST